MLHLKGGGRLSKVGGAGGNPAAAGGGTAEQQGGAAGSATANLAGNARTYDLYDAEADVNREKRTQRHLGAMASSQVLCVCPLMILSLPLYPARGRHTLRSAGAAGKCTKSFVKRQSLGPRWHNGAKTPGSIKLLTTEQHQQRPKSSDSPAPG
uniref:Uncharacterized protein n=1 Tax=Anopheles merus TaxID=30066 RepID=A0A182VG77_ANOME